MKHHEDRKVRTPNPGAPFGSRLPNLLVSPGSLKAYFHFLFDSSMKCPYVPIYPYIDPIYLSSRACTVLTALSYFHIGFLYLHQP